MTTTAFLLSLSDKPPAERIAELDGALWGQSVDPVWPGDDHSVILLPWPARALHPNARGHFMARARATKKARHDAWLATLAAVSKPRRAELRAAAKLRAHVRFFPPDNRNRDEDGMVPSVKSQLDGIADALGVNDGRFRLSHEVEGVTKGGRVIVEISE